MRKELSVPFFEQSLEPDGGINALKDGRITLPQIADYVEEYNLDGVNVDIENVTHEQREQYTELVRLLREKIPSHKEVSVAVAASPNDWQSGMARLLRLCSACRLCRSSFIMAYDEHHEGGEAGPVASIDFVERSIQYALEKRLRIKLSSVSRSTAGSGDWIAAGSPEKGSAPRRSREILSNCESHDNLR